MSALGFNVMNFRHELDIGTVQGKMPGIVPRGRVSESRT
jgi:hypothetical protein